MPTPLEKPENRMRKWLKNHTCCVLATSCQNKPWAASMTYKADDDLNIYLSTDPQSLKYQNVLKNPIVSIVVDNQDDEGTLQIQGTAQPYQPKAGEEFNLVVKPNFLIFNKKEPSGDITTLRVNL